MSVWNAVLFVSTQENEQRMQRDPCCTDKKREWDPGISSSEPGAAGQSGRTDRTCLGSSVDSFSGSIRVHMSSLRKKLKAELGYDPVVNKIGEGYKIGGNDKT